MIVFFTLPPSNIDYPYVLVNANNPDNGIRYILNHRRAVKTVIIDSGIEIFRDPNVKDYPDGYWGCLKRQVALYRRVKSMVPHAEIYVTACDYCDDYHPKNLWLSEDFTNIERTVISVLTAVDYFPEVPWLIPIQGWYKQPESMVMCLEYYHQLGILDRYNYFAVANVARDCETIAKSVRIVSRWLEGHGYRNKRLHLFGLSLRCVDHVKYYIHSFDTMAWTRPVNSKLRRKYPFSAKNAEQRRLFFEEWLRHLERKVVSKSRSILDFL